MSTPLHYYYITQQEIIHCSRNELQPLILDLLFHGWVAINVKEPMSNLSTGFIISSPE